jgi:hypothetical protein
MACHYQFRMISPCSFTTFAGICAPYTSRVYSPPPFWTRPPSAPQAVRTTYRGDCQPEDDQFGAVWLQSFKSILAESFTASGPQREYHCDLGRCRLKRGSGEALALQVELT